MKAHRSRSRLAAALVLQLLLCSPASGNPSALVAGVSQIVSGGAPGPLHPMATAWFAIAAGDEDASFPSMFALARDYGQGRVVVLGHDGLPTNFAALDNDQFLLNTIGWLDQSGAQSVKYTTGHQEWVTGGSMAAFQSALASFGYTFQAMPAPITAAQLSGISVLIVGNAWGSFSASEIESVRQWVEQGGGLFLLGLGWSWEPYHPGTTIEDYPMMQLAAPYAVRWLRGVIGDPTNVHNGSPVFHTFYPDIAMATVTSAMAAIDTEHAAQSGTLAGDLETDAALRLRFVRAHLTLAIPAREFPAGHPERQQVFDYLADLVEREPGSYARLAPFDQNAHPTATHLRERVLRTWYECLSPTPAVKAQIAAGSQMSGVALDVFDDFGIILLDNLRLDAAQLDYIHTYFSLLPPALHDLRVISVNDDLGSPPIAVPLDGATSGVNIFGVPIGGYNENSFPPDVPPGVVDGFSIVVAHEANHVVDAEYVLGDPALSARRAQLISDAGTDPLNYLRSMISPGFFTQNPQEFFASISNQWFTDSVKTIELGIVRFDAGRTDPINQALFFADVYSLAGGSTFFYTNDTAGSIARTSVPLHRNGAGFIDEIDASGVHYCFALDAAGRVTSYDACIDDGNPCTHEVCNAGVCTHPNNTAPCTDDGIYCTKDVCAGGACTHACDIGKACTGPLCLSGQTCQDPNCQCR